MVVLDVPSEAPPPPVGEVLSGDLIALATVLAAEGKGFAQGILERVAKNWRPTENQMAALRACAAQRATRSDTPQGGQNHPENPDAVRTRASFGVRWAKAMRQTYAAPSADLIPAGRLWAEAEQKANELRAAAGEGWAPSAKELAAYWLDKFFAETDRKTIDQGYPFAWLASRLGSYGLPPPPREHRPAAAMTPPEPAGVPLPAEMLAELTRRGGSGPSGPRVPRPGTRSPPSSETPS